MWAAPRELFLKRVKEAIPPSFPKVEQRTEWRPSQPFSRAKARRWRQWGCGGLSLYASALNKALTSRSFPPFLIINPRIVARKRWPQAERQSLWVVFTVSQGAEQSAPPEAFVVPGGGIQLQWRENPSDKKWTRKWWKIRTGKSSLGVWIIENRCVRCLFPSSVHGCACMSSLIE